MNELLMSNPLALPLIVVSAICVVLALALTYVVFTTRELTAPPIVEAMANLVPADVVREHTASYLQVWQESQNAQKQLLAHIANGGINLLDAVQDDMRETVDNQRLQKIDLPPGGITGNLPLDIESGAFGNSDEPK